MKIIDVTSLAIPEVMVIKFGRYPDERGYFTEIFRKSDLMKLDFMAGVEFRQCNEAYSKKGTVRGCHFQWNPYMGKMVRVLWGRLIDLAIDIRKGSPAYGKIVGHELTSRPSDDTSEWIWLPPGFAHCTVLPEESHIEYFCSAEYSPGCEGIISPLAKDIDWSLCDKKIKREYDSIVPKTKLMTEKDRNGLTMAQWSADKRSDNFLYGKL